MHVRYSQIKQNIEDHGGIVTREHQGWTYQILPENHEFDSSQFYKGQIYREQWLLDSIDQGILIIVPGKYCETINDASNALVIKKRSSRLYNVRECLLIYSIGTIKKEEDEVETMSKKFW